MNQNYLMVNQSTNVVDNICFWDGNSSMWQPPSGYLMLIQATTPAIVWQPVGSGHTITDWVLTEVIGAGSVGFTWNGTECLTNEPKPEIPIN